MVILVGLLCLGTAGTTLGAGQSRTVWDGIYTDERQMPAPIRSE